MCLSFLHSIVCFYLTIKKLNDRKKKRIISVYISNENVQDDKITKSSYKQDILRNTKHLKNNK